jgi:hypothetical protein
LSDDKNEKKVITKKSVIENIGKIVIDVGKIAGILVTLTILAGTIIKFISDKQK